MLALHCRWCVMESRIRGQKRPTAFFLCFKWHVFFLAKCVTAPCLHGGQSFQANILAIPTGIKFDILAVHCFLCARLIWSQIWPKTPFFGFLPRIPCFFGKMCHSTLSPWLPKLPTQHFSVNYRNQM